MRCDRCGELESAIFRTGPLGEEAEWYCEACMVETGHAPELEELQDLVRVLKMLGQGEE